MPTTTIPRARGVEALQATIADIERTPATVVQVVDVGDQWLIVWFAKPRQGRPPKQVETR
jgi:hypothetical protein